MTTDAQRAAALAELTAMLEPMLRLLADLPPGAIADDAGAAALRGQLEARWPRSGAEATALAQRLRDGVAQGWLCDRGEPDARFSRVAKPSPTTHGFSLDVVSLRGAAAEHAHPAGEITLALPHAPGDDDDARFDGHGPGWVVLPAGSRHVPTVTGGRMLLLYALPGGAIAWGPA